VLTRLFETTKSESLRWAIANTLSCTQPEGVQEWILRSVQDGAYGKGREMLAIALARLLPADVANPVLVSLLGDLPVHAAAGLAVSGTRNELAALQSAYDRAKGLTKKQMAKSIKAIERRERRL
jgi:hypothetical protein